MPSAGVQSLVASHRHDPTRLLQLLIDAQSALGWVSPQTITEVARELSLPRARVEGVATFYSFLCTRPMGEYRVLFSDDVTDRFQGSEALRDRLCARLGVSPGEPRADGRVSVGGTSCTGLCDQGPALLVNGRAIARLDPGRIEQIARCIEQRLPLDGWPVELFEIEDQVRLEGPLLSAPFSPGDGVRAAFGRGAGAMLDELSRSKLRGRGGAGFETARKWRSARDAPGPTRFVVCNADEGEPGTFKDRVLLRRRLDLVLDGMTIAALVIGAQKGFLYLRGEYLFLREHLERALAARRTAGLLGRDVLGHGGFDFDLEVHLGAGAYVCGEESALLESLEGRRGIPRSRPPYPVTHGYLGRPTVVNNVETLACVALIATRGARAIDGRLHSVSGDCERPGIYELPLGTPVEQLLERCGARAPQAVQVGGPSGTLLAPREFGRALSFEDVPTAGSFMVFDGSRDLLEVTANFCRFFAHESCGFCTPCRVGTTQLAMAIDNLAAGRGTRRDVRHALRLCTLLTGTSHCGLGQTAAHPFASLYEKFKPSVEQKLSSLAFMPTFAIDESLAPAREVTGRDDPHAHLEDT